MEEKTIIIDKYYEDSTKEEGSRFFIIDKDLDFGDCHLDIRVPLICKGLISAKSIKAIGSLTVGEHVKVKDSLTVGGWLKVRDSLSVGGSLYVGGFLSVGWSIEVIKSLKVVESIKTNKWLEVGGFLSVGESLKVNMWLKVGKWLKVFGKKTNIYMFMNTGDYPVTFTTSLIKIGGEMHKVAEWKNATDTQISRIGNGALEWWENWGGPILAMHENLPKIYPNKNKVEYV